MWIQVGTMESCPVSVTTWAGQTCPMRISSDRQVNSSRPSTSVWGGMF